MQAQKTYDETQIERIRCNYCGSDTTKAIYDFSPLHIVKCRKCGLVYTNPRLKLSVIEESLYQQDFFSAYDAEYEKNLPSIRGFYARWLEALSRHMDKQQWKICEVGPGLGGFLAEAKELGHEVYGVELSE